METLEVGSVKRRGHKLLTQKTLKVMDLCLLLCGFEGELRKLHELEMEQGPPRSGGDLEGA